ncbi:aminomethyl transferase family protein [Novosphingobium flavum]|uniref:Aminomethyl transferase family protein n=2 Tax=Novosphingobium flavum TaxID=1778672 RepID=A0A7X1FU17_9SPHN|nr:aminomethyl transferase family protein [Novosphingobium flavum]
MRKPPVGYFNVRFGQPEYTDWLDESMSWKQTCYIGDWSFLWQRRLRGPDAARLLSDISVNSFANYAVGRSKHLIHTDVNGNIIHEGVLSKLGEEDFMLFGRGGFWADYCVRHGNYDVESQEDDWFVFQVSGPLAIHVVEKAAGRSMRDVKFMHFDVIKIAGHDVWALRQGMAGEIGYELQGPKAYGQEIYNAILEAGAEFGIRRLGARVSGVNHLEACFPTIVVDYLPAIFEPEMEDYRNEFEAAMPAFATTFNVAGSFPGAKVSDYYRNPVELGWSKVIKFDHDFVGRTALEELVANPRRTIRTLVWNPEDVADVYMSLFREGEPYPVMELPRDQRGYMWVDEVRLNGNVIGAATSRGYSYFFREMISLATIDVKHAEIGKAVTVIWGNPGGPQKEIRATIAPAPYKKDNRRLDVHRL